MAKLRDWNLKETPEPSILSNSRSSSEETKSQGSEFSQDQDPWTSPSITLDQVRVVSGTFTVVEQASAVFPPRKCSVLMGVAGSGKSTILKTAAGLMVPVSGQVLMNDLDINTFSRKDELRFRSLSGFVFQDAALWQDTSAYQNVAMPLRIHQPDLDPKALYTKVDSMIRKTGFTDNSNLRPAELSTGEQKLLSLARALVHEPRLVFMDNPSSNIDEDSIERLYTIIDELKDQEVTLIIATNISEIAYRFADHLGVIRDGKILAFGEYEDTLNKVEMILSSSLSKLKARGKRGLKELEHEI
jgi:phospholipid/cholesterol/gamma-HCH transport system ATP-binding protein